MKINQHNYKIQYQRNESPRKKTQQKKEDKQPVSENTVKSQPKDGQNEQKTIADAQQETKPIITKAQKKLQMEYYKCFLENNRTKKDIYATKLKLGICKNKYTKKELRQSRQLLKQCIKGNHHQAMPIQQNLRYRPKGELVNKN
ncbi:Hypothetical_protein [Hexamita inflata]|uniref:Hypothetical_protein n=1 Tax=Hexamita inflata TaxID=28002 RepID=A0AA86TJ00_9EUKA|nr:Hypothetical protein HINF_LOCUS7754 [Hexamita inflata]